MRTLVLLAALAAVAFCLPSFCHHSTYDDIPYYDHTYPMDATSKTTWCFKFEMSPSGSKDAYVGLRRRTRFNSSSSHLFFCASDDEDTITTTCTSSKSRYSWYADVSTPSVYAIIEYSPSGVDSGKWMDFEIRKFRGSSASSWDGYCTSGNCASRGACLYNGTCWCDEGYSGCDATGLLEWIIYLIVVMCILVVLVPIIIIICCCCCCTCCAAAAAAGAAR